MIISIMLVILGVITYEAAYRDHKKPEWYVYFLLIGGAVGTTLGAVLMAVGLLKSMRENPENQSTYHGHRYRSEDYEGDEEEEYYVEEKKYKYR